mmetsp:Transcript_34211/g.88356  ORF Transcript_34211/g.88356 Transcript_34211/m.88356 type:complete len:922 (-) Transcript_34211:296-3061(-)
MGEPASDAFQEIEHDLDFLPPAAIDEEIRRYDHDIKSKEVRLKQVAEDISENAERVTVMQEHLKNVQQEILHTQQLCDAKGKEIHTENHLLQLADREAGRYRQELEQLEKQSIEIQDKLNTVQNSIFRGNEKMDHYKVQMNLNQEEIEQWALAAKQKEEDSMALEKYRKADDAKLKDLNLAIEKLAKEVQRKKHELESEITETQAAQIELDKTAEDFRSTHKDRQELVRQWEETIDAMHRRDEEIRAAGEKYSQNKEKQRGIEETLNEKKEFLESEVANNKEVEQKIKLVERTVQKKRLDLVASQKAADDLRDEVDVVRNTLNKVASDLNQGRAEVINIRRAVEGKKDRLEKAEKRHAETVRKLETEYKATDDLEKHSKLVEQMQKQEELRMKQMDKRLEELKEEMFKKSQDLFKLRQEEANYIAEISGAQTASKNLQAKIQALDAESLKQQELIYNADFQIQQMERRVARAQGERSMEERKILNAKIEELTGNLEEQVAQHTMLVQQIKRLEDDLRAARRTVTSHEAEKEKLTSRIAELNLENSTVAQTLKSAIKKKEDTMVAHDLLKLEVKNLRDVLNYRADEVFSLENRKQQLQMSMDEREKEISMHKDVLSAELRLAEEERHRAAMELKDRSLRVDTLEKKYEVMVGRGGDGEEEHMPAYYVVKRAQEREELQREGDVLDQKIRKAEREIKALENTLGKLKTKNTSFRESFHKASVGSTEWKEKKELEKKKEAAMDRRKYLRRMKESIEQDVTTMSSRLSNLSKEHRSLEEHVAQVEVKYNNMQKDTNGMYEKIDRAEKQVQRLSRELHREKGGDAAPMEKDFELTERKYSNRAALHALAEVTSQFPGIGDEVQTLLTEHGLKIPSRPSSSLSRPSSRGGQSYAGSSRGSHASSVVSSRASMASASSARVKNVALNL